MKIIFSTLKNRHNIALLFFLCYSTTTFNSSENPPQIKLHENTFEEEYKNDEIAHIDKILQNKNLSENDRNLLNKIKQGEQLTQEENIIAAIIFASQNHDDLPFLELQELRNPETEYESQNRQYGSNANLLQSWEKKSHRNHHTYGKNFQVFLSKENKPSAHFQSALGYSSSSSLHVTKLDMPNFQTISEFKQFHLDKLCENYPIKADSRDILLYCSCEKKLWIEKTLPEKQNTIAKLQEIHDHMENMVTKKETLEAFLKKYSIKVTTLLQALDQDEAEREKIQSLSYEEKNSFMSEFEQSDTAYKMSEFFTKIIISARISTQQEINTGKTTAKIDFETLESAIDKNQNEAINVNKKRKLFVEFVKALINTIGTNKLNEEYHKAAPQIIQKKHNKATTNELLKEINNFNNNRTFIVMQKEKKGKIYTFSPELHLFFEKTIGWTTNTQIMMNKLSDLHRFYSEPFAHHRYEMKVKLESFKEDPLKFMTLLAHPLYAIQTNNLLECELAAAQKLAFCICGKKVEINDDENETLYYSSNMIATSEECKKFTLDPHNKTLILKGNNYFSVKGIGGIGKTAVMETFLQEVAFVLNTGHSMHADIKVSKSLRKQSPCLYKMDNQIQYLGKKPRSGSQSTQLKVRDFNELCEEAIKNNYIIYGYADETFAGVDYLSMPNLIDSQKGPKEAFAHKKLYFGIIEHDHKKINHFNCPSRIEFPIKLSNNTISFSEIKHHVIIKQESDLQESDLQESAESTEILNEDEFNAIYEVLSNKLNQAGTEVNFYFEITKQGGQEQFRVVNEETYKKERSRNNDRFVAIKYIVKTSTNSENNEANVKVFSNQIIIKPIIAIVSDANKNKFLFQIDFTIKLDPLDKEHFIPKPIPISGTKDRFKAVKISSLFLDNKTIKFINEDEKNNLANITSSSISDFPEIAPFIEESINKERSDNNFMAIKEYMREKEEERPSLFYWNDWEVTE